jgi:hypothetical protein
VLRGFVEARFTNCAASLLLSFAESTAQQVADWAQGLGLSATAVKVLIDNELDGAALLEMAAQPEKELRKELVKAPYSLMGGPAIKLAKAISALHGDAQGERGVGGRVCCVEFMCLCRQVLACVWVARGQCLGGGKCARVS